MLGIVINPRSGKTAYRMQRLYLFRLLKKNRQPFAYKVTKYAGHAIELARELVEKGYDQILILGGDGTLSEVINGIMTAKVSAEDRKKVQFGLMPRGTGNDWARFWKLDKNYKRSLKLFMLPHAIHRYSGLTMLMMSALFSLSTMATGMCLFSWQ